MSATQTQDWLIERMAENAKQYDHTIRWRMGSMFMRVFDGDHETVAIPRMPDISLKFKSVLLPPPPPPPLPRRRAVELSLFSNYLCCSTATGATGRTSAKSTTLNGGGRQRRCRGSTASRWDATATTTRQRTAGGGRRRKDASPTGLWLRISRCVLQLQPPPQPPPLHAPAWPGPVTIQLYT